MGLSWHFGVHGFPCSNFTLLGRGRCWAKHASPVYCMHGPHLRQVAVRPSCPQLHAASCLTVWDRQQGLQLATAAMHCHCVSVFRACTPVHVAGAVFCPLWGLLHEDTLIQQAPNLVCTWSDVGILFRVCISACACEDAQLVHTRASSGDFCANCTGDCGVTRLSGRQPKPGSYCAWSPAWLVLA